MTVVLATRVDAAAGPHASREAVMRVVTALGLPEALGARVAEGVADAAWRVLEAHESALLVFSTEPDAPPTLGAIIGLIEDHAARLVAIFGEREAMLQMRKWCAWYTKGFAGSASVRAALVRLESLEDMRRELARLDPAEPFPLAALRAHRAKGSRTQRVALPEGYLDARDDDTPPEECGADLEAALQSG